MIPATSMVSRHEAALVVIDPQDRLAAAMSEREGVLSGITRLVRVAALTDVPIVATRQYPKGLGDLDARVLSALGDAEDAGASVRRVDKVCFDCLSEPSFVDAVAATGRRQLVLCGMETHICITQTALDALGQGYDVHVVADAVCSRSQRDHTTALSRLRCAGAVVTTHESVLYELIERAGSDEFKELLGIVKG